MSNIKKPTTKQKNSENEMFATLLELQRRNMVLSEWAQENTLKQRATQMQQEVEELMVELDRDNAKRIADELGDVLWDCVGTIARGEYEGKFKMQEILDHIHKKYTQRKPFLVANKKVTRDEEWKVWNEVKARQKEEQAKHYGSN